MKYEYAEDVLIALKQAREEAIALGHDFVSTRHILVALLVSPGRAELPRAKDPDGLRRALVRSCGPATRRGKEIPRQLPYTGSAKHSLEYAMADARERGQRGNVTLPNLLAGVLRADTEAAEIAREYGMVLESSQQETGGATAERKGEAGDGVWYVKVDASSETPIYEQIVQRIEEAVATGKLDAGERLPAVRELAAELEVAPGTVARAYAALEESGVVITEGARGTRVAKRTVTRGRDAERESALEALLKPIVVAAFHMGAKAQELRDALERAMKGILNGGTRSA